MPYNDVWFTGADVARVLKGLQVWPEAGTLSPDGTLLATLFQEQCDISADAIKDDIERKTGRKPLLATRLTIPHTQTEFGGRLLLKVPALEIHSVTIAGNVIPVDTYWNEPSEYEATGEPIESIQFAHNYSPGWSYGFPNQILVDAEFGSYLAVPPMLWRAGLNMATLLTLATIQGYPDIASWSEDGFSEASDLVGPIDDKTRLNFWPAQYEKACKEYQRVVV